MNREGKDDALERREGIYISPEIGSENKLT